MFYEILADCEALERPSELLKSFELLDAYLLWMVQILEFLDSVIFHMIPGRDALCCLLKRYLLVAEIVQSQSKWAFC